MLIGAHESIAGGVSKAFARAEEHGARSLQIFTKSARGWNAPPLSDDEQRAFRSEHQRSRIPAIAHGSYLVNLATDDPRLREQSIRCVVDELTRSERLGIPYLVLHPGSHADERAGLGLVGKALDEIHAATPHFAAKICLEVTAGQGSSLGWKFSHLAEMLSATAANERLGVCLDTCHLFAAGYDISTRDGYEKTLEEFDRAIGLGRVRCLHLNDCKKPLGCRVDRHEEIGEGMLGLEVFRWLANEPRFAETVGVLETPNPENYGAAISRLESLVRSR